MIFHGVFPQSGESDFFYFHSKINQLIIKHFFEICRLNEKTLKALSLKKKNFPLINLEKTLIVGERKNRVGVK